MNIRPIAPLIAPLIAWTLLLAALAAGVPSTARAAQDYDGCAGFIDSLPATIGTQGVWCLRKDLSTAQSSGVVIDVTTNNVTIDCNDFKLGGLAAGDASTATGIWSLYRNNITVRNCNIRGFYQGVGLNGGSGHLVEDNRFDNNLWVGIIATGAHSVVRRNRVFDTGGRPGGNPNTTYNTYGIACGIEEGSCEAIDNVVEGMLPVEASANRLHGIYALGPASRIAGNAVRGLAGAEDDLATGIYHERGAGFIEDNEVTFAAASTNAVGYACEEGTTAVLRGNRAWAASTGFAATCLDDGGNVAD